MHIVALTGDYYPNIMAPSSCFKPYLEEFAKTHEVEIICPVTNIHYKSTIINDGIVIHFASCLSSRIIAKANTNIIDNVNIHLSRFISSIGRVSNYLKEEILPSPFDVSLINSYLEILEGINTKRKIDLVISVTFPFYTHVVGLKYKQLHPDAKWLTYSTDPLAYNEANPIPRWKIKGAKRIEKKVYEYCDCCLITEELLHNVAYDYHIPQNKILVLPYLIETDRVPTLLSGVKQNDRPQVLYAGCLFHRVRNPQLLLDVFSELQDIDLNLYVTGDRKCRKILRDSFPPNISINSVVPREEYFSLLSQADILVNLSNNAKLQAPHKLLELISTGRPIINFYYFKNTSYGIIEKYPLGINISNSLNANEIRLIIRDFVMKNRNKHLSDKEIKDIFPENLLLFQMARIKELLR